VYTQEEIDAAKRREEDAAINQAARQLPTLVFLYDCILPMPSRYFHSVDGTKHSANFWLKSPYTSVIPELIFRSAVLVNLKQNPSFSFDSPDLMVKAIEARKNPPPPPAATLRTGLDYSNGLTDLTKVLIDRVAQPATPPPPTRSGLYLPDAPPVQPAQVAKPKPGEVVLDQGTYDRLRSDAASFQLVKEADRRPTQSATAQAPVEKFAPSTLKMISDWLITLAKLTYSPISFTSPTTTWRHTHAFRSFYATGANLESMLDFTATKSIWKELGYDLPSSFPSSKTEWLYFSTKQNMVAILPPGVFEDLKFYGIVSPKDFNALIDALDRMGFYPSKALGR
jgi:hypothetical protein